MAGFKCLLTGSLRTLERLLLLHMLARAGLLLLQMLPLERLHLLIMLAL